MSIKWGAEKIHWIRVSHKKFQDNIGKLFGKN